MLSEADYLKQLEHPGPIGTRLSKKQLAAQRRLRRRLMKYGVALVSALVAYGLAAPQQAQKVLQLAGSTSPGQWRVTEAVDGDTLLVEQNGHKETVRLIGVDTPETKDPRKPVQCFGKAASEYTRQIAEGKLVRLEADPADSDRDKYKRLLRYVYLPDGTLLNAQIIKDGYGFVYTIFPYAKLEDFRQLERNARAQNLGLWAGCKVDESTQIKQTQSQP